MMHSKEFIFFNLLQLNSALQSYYYSKTHYIYIFFNRAHPHRLMGKDRKVNKGIYTLEINDETAILSDLTIQYVKKTDIAKSLNERALAKVDPFNSKKFVPLFSTVTIENLMNSFILFLLRSLSRI